MFRRTIAVFALALLSLPAICSQDDEKMDAFVSDLMSRMTLEEKLGQLNLPVSGEIVTGAAKSSNAVGKIKQGQVGGLFNVKGAAVIRELQEVAVDSSRLGIPLLFGMDVIHGYETVFPIPLGLSCTWDMEAIEESARIAAKEASSDGISWTFSPMVDISRDPRWGRCSEGSGEDPFLGSEIAKAMVYGYQGRPGMQYAEDYNMMACVKHFALYGAVEAGRDYNTVDMSRSRMFNEYFPPYKAAVDAGVGSVMASFNTVDGVPATVNPWLLTDVLRRDWGFGGMVVTDYTGIAECVPHGVGDFHEVAVKALNAGVDMDMVSEAFLSQLADAVRDGEVSQVAIDAACRRVLEAKYRLGLFDDPFKFCREEEAASVVYSKEHRATARKISADSYVLLKNDPFKGHKLLPLKAEGTVALIGPLADTRPNMPGTWSVAARLNDCPSLREGLQELYGDKVKFLYAQGSNLTSDAEIQSRATMFGREIPRGDDDALLREALRVARRADVIVAALGESSEMSGESSSRTEIGIPDAQKRLLKALVETGKPVVLVLFDGRPLTIEWEHDNVPAILNVWFGGSEAAYSIGDVLFGEVNPSGKLTMTFPRNEGQIPIYYERLNTGRPCPANQDFVKFTTGYLDSKSTPLYPFGYGLSYTEFEYGPVQLSSNALASGGTLTASVEVKNVGEREGKEVVQLYIRDLVGKVARPLRQLRGFEKISLGAGESRVVSFEITPEMLGYYDGDARWTLESGQFEVFIGSDSTTSNLATFTLL